MEEMGEIASADRIFKILMKLNKNRHKPDLHSFTAKTNDGMVYVDCREDGVFAEHIYYDEKGDEKKWQFWGTPIAVANGLDRLQIDFDTIDI